MDTIITSSSNPTVKYIRKLMTSGKARKQSNMYVAEGAHLVKSLMDAGYAPAMYAYAEKASHNPEIAGILKQASRLEVDCVAIADSLFESITSIHASVGILALFSPKGTHEAPALTKSSAVLLDEVQDPGNAGTILRTAAAVGITDAFLSSGCASPWAPKTLRAGMGAQFSLQIHEDADLTKVIREATIPTLLTILSPDSKSLYEADLSRPVAWIFCNEGQGASQQLLDVTSDHIHIPQANTPVESLNVAAAAAVCLYEQYRQTTHSNPQG